MFKMLECLEYLKHLANFKKKTTQNQLINQSVVGLNVCLTRLYTVGWSTPHLDIPKNDNGQFRKWKLNYSI